MSTDMICLLNHLGASEFEGGIAAWGGSKLCTPYTAEDIAWFSRIQADDNDALRREFDVFKGRLAALPDEDRRELRRWVQAEFVDPIWAVMGKKFPRPTFAVKRFFSPMKDCRGKLLDIAPDRGAHGLLLYRDHYRLNFDFHSMDALPSYNKMLAMLGISVAHYNANHDRIVNDGVAYDVVTCTEFLEHVVQAAEDRILEDIRRVTKAGSRLLITFPEHAVEHGVESDVMGHIRQPDLDHISSNLPEFATLDSGLFFGGRSNQRYLIAERR